MSDTAVRAREQRIAEIRERESKATKGPWCWDNRGEKCDDIQIGIALDANDTALEGSINNFEVDEVDYCESVAGEVKSPLDADFIAHARADIPFLLEQLSAQSAAPVEEVARELAQAFRDWRDSEASKYYSCGTPDEVFAMVLREHGYGAQGVLMDTLKVVRETLANWNREPELNSLAVHVDDIIIKAETLSPVPSTESAPPSTEELQARDKWKNITRPLQETSQSMEDNARESTEEKR